MPPAIPIATYRLQLSADFDFDAAAAVVPYLKALGITILCLALHAARKGSTHGYDVTDHASSIRSSAAKPLRAAERRAAATRSRADPGFRAQPCRRAFCR
jgi:maltooligosyltrehalose synthase